jgi:hypothetical protein
MIEKPTTHPGTNGPNENQIGDQRGVSTLICTDETYRILLSISRAMFTRKQFQYLIETIQLYHFTDEQWNNLKAILIGNKDRFTDDQWKMVNHLLSENRLNDEQFGFFVDMFDTSTQKLVLLHAGGGTRKPLLNVKSLKSWPDEMKFAVARVQPGLALHTYHKAKLSIVFSRHGHQV